jgi:hypothetical protein
VPIKCKGPDTHHAAAGAVPDDEAAAAAAHPHPHPHPPAPPGAGDGSPCYVNANHDENDAYYFNHSTPLIGYEKYVSEGRCNFFTTTPKAEPVTLTATHNRLTCTATVEASADVKQGEQWALFAFDGQIEYVYWLQPACIFT